MDLTRFSRCFAALIMLFSMASMQLAYAACRYADGITRFGSTANLQASSWQAYTPSVDAAQDDRESCRKSSPDLRQDRLAVGKRLNDHQDAIKLPSYPLPIRVFQFDPAGGLGLTLAARPVLFWRAHITTPSVCIRDCTFQI
jgi:hypothetical protein